jgi:aspartate aminotransferase
MEPPPDVIIAATRRAMERGDYRYGPSGGIAELRQAVAERFDGWGPANMLITNGSKQGLYQALQVICDPGDEILVLTPCWGSFIHQIRLAGGVPVLVTCGADHQPDVDALRTSLSPRTRAIIVNSPNNPTGAVYSWDHLKAMSDVCMENNLYAIADEAYEDFVFDGRPFRSLFEFEPMRDRLMVMRSFSKGFSMTGFRIGYTAGPEALIREMDKLQSHLTGNPCTFAQHGAMAAMGMGSEWVTERRARYEKKRDLAYAGIKRKLDCVRPQGAFYLFADFTQRDPKRFQSSEAFSERLLEETGVAVVPGSVFGSDRHVRISFAAAESTLREGIERIGAFL